jgi:hypothetical protein
MTKRTPATDVTTDQLSKFVKIVARPLLLEKPKERREKQTDSAIRFSCIVTDSLLKTRPREHDRNNKK